MTKTRKYRFAIIGTEPLRGITIARSLFPASRVKA
jgi:hypothetical protein